MSTDTIRFHVIAARRAHAEAAPGPEADAARDQALAGLLADAMVEARRLTGTATRHVMHRFYGFELGELDRIEQRATDLATERWLTVMHEGGELLVYDLAGVAAALGMTGRQFQDARPKLRKAGFPEKLPGAGHRWSRATVDHWIRSNGGTYAPLAEMPADALQGAREQLEARYAG